LLFLISGDTYKVWKSENGTDDAQCQEPVDAAKECQQVC
jgi:hypothetical protein